MIDIDNDNVFGFLLDLPTPCLYSDTLCETREERRLYIAGVVLETFISTLLVTLPVGVVIGLILSTLRKRGEAFKTWFRQVAPTVTTWLRKRGEAFKTWFCQESINRAGDEGDPVPPQNKA